MNNVFWLHHARRLGDEYVHSQEETEQDEFDMGLGFGPLSLSEDYFTKKQLTKEVPATFSESQLIAYPKWWTVYREWKIKELLAASAPNGIDSQSEEEPTVESVGLPNPPRKAEYILYLFLRKDEREAVIGDLLENYSSNLKRFGARPAKLLLYTEVLRSLWPLFRRLATKVTGLLALGEWIRRHVS